MPKTEVDAGTELVREFLEAWRARAGETEEEQVSALKETVEEYKGRFEGSAWVKGVLASL